MTEKSIEAIIEQGEECLKPQFLRMERIALQNQSKVLQAMRMCRVSDLHLQPATGYGYGNPGREVLDQVYAKVFHTEAALVRGQFVSGTHAVGTALFAALRPGDSLLSLTGLPYDTMRQVIGLEGSAAGNLKMYGIGYKQLDLDAQQQIDLAGIAAVLTPDVKAVLIQRSRGYEWRNAFSIAEIKRAIQTVKALQPSARVIIDNCYGEFTDFLEPTDVGADLIAGSLIKNPGGGLAPGGGYLAGSQELIAAAAARYSMPGLGLEMGSSFGDSQRLMFQGLFLAPHTVAQAVKGMHLLGFVMQELGYDVSPAWQASRNDIIQAIRFSDSKPLIEFCRAVQRASPVDAHVLPEPWDMPGYSHPVIMAAGTFVQGASIELSADAPLRAPYTAYVQGGLTYEHIKLAILEIALHLQSER
ncbi:MAG: methionine gamma-lyase family protein [Negativicutes bacterium]|nr:methionine gamma-lyase family protein [Negativicutes bacterium]